MNTVFLNLNLKVTQQSVYFTNIKLSNIFLIPVYVCYCDEKAFIFIVKRMVLFLCAFCDK